MSLEAVIQNAHAQVKQGKGDLEISRNLVNDYQLSPLELGVALNHSVMFYSHTKTRRNTAAATMTNQGSNQTIEDAIYLASLLVAAIPGITPSDVAVALKDPRNYPNLTATQMGEVLKADEVFPSITADAMRTALHVAGYADADIDQAIAQLYPAPPVTVTYRRMGPAGMQGQMPFDDNNLATAGNALTQIIVRHGNIIDSIQAFYGATASAVHGGEGGGPKTIPVSASDPIVEVSGYTGYWFGVNYVLQLTLKTRSGQVSGPYGDMAYSNSQTPFSFQVGSNEQIVGFFGSATYGDNGRMTLLGSLGVIIQTS